ncbi:MAG: acyltransferase [Gemmataceae bacterium]|nr:acyltransferase [Gemmataceae bacterium]
MSIRNLLKWATRLASTLAVVPVLILHILKVPLLGKDRALEGSTQLLAIVPGISGQYLRQALLAWTIQECHPTASIGFGTIFSKTAARIGESVYIGSYCSFGSVTIERDALIATGVHVLSGSKMHGIGDPTRPIREQPGEFVHVTLGAGCWIGAGAIVMADVGRDSVIGAGAVVTKSIPEQVIAAGVPAKVVRERITALVDPQSE